MRLTIHTDYGLRFLMVGALMSPRPIAVKDVAARFGISSNHLMKVAQNLAKAGWVEPMRGRSGGFRLSKPPGEIGIGDVVRSLETDFGLVECMRETDATCPITPACRLPRLLHEATAAFVAVLDTCTLADLVEDNTPLIRILESVS